MTDVATPEPTRRALRKQRDKEQRTSSILQAAEKLFASKGYQQTSMEEIADLAEISPGTIYFYFKNKEDLLIQLLQDCGYVLRKTLGEELGRAGYSLDGFCSVGQTIVTEFCVNYPEKTAILFRETVGQSREVEEVRKRLFERIADDLRSALEISGITNKKNASGPLAELLGVMIVGIFTQVAFHYLIWRDEYDAMTKIAGKTAAFLKAGIIDLLGLDPAEANTNR